MELFRLHRVLKHLETTFISKLIRQSLGENPLPPAIRKELEKFRCSECAANTELPRKPKLAMTHEATNNIAVLLDVMPQHIRNNR